MLRSAMQKLKNKKFKSMAVALTKIDDNRRTAILDEYFNICKCIYMIRAEFAYNWYNS